MLRPKFGAVATRNRSSADEVVLSHSATVPCNFLDFFDMFLGRICSPGVTPDMKDGVPGRYRVLWSLVCGVHCTGNRSALTIFDSCLLGQRQCAAKDGRFIDGYASTQTATAPRVVL